MLLSRKSLNLCNRKQFEVFMQFIVLIPFRYVLQYFRIQKLP